MFVYHYPGWTASRMSGINKYIDPTFFQGKKMLEMGCGWAVNGNEFSKLGCDVTSCDVRQEHLEVARTMYSHLKFLLVDGDDHIIPPGFDIILHWGLLYHLYDVEAHVKAVSENCNYLLLESEIVDSSEDFQIVVEERGFDQAFHNKGTHASETRIEAFLTRGGFQFRKIMDPILNFGIHLYDQPIRETKLQIMGNRRFWICWKSDVPSPMRPGM